MKAIFLLLLVIPTLSLADSEVPKQEPAKPQVIAVEDAAKLKASLDKEITVSGTPNAKSAVSETGHFFYNFDNSEMMVFCFSASAAKFPDDKKPAALIGKKIVVSGKLTLYKEKLQIAIRQPEQIQILDAGATAPAAEK